jgi:hypothetical protein
VRLFDGVFMIKRFRAIQTENSSQVNLEMGLGKAGADPGYCPPVSSLSPGTKERKGR